MILADTSVWIDYFNSYGSEEADFLTLCIAEVRDPIVLPGLVLTETLQGVRDAASRPSAPSARLLTFELAPELTSDPTTSRPPQSTAPVRTGGRTPRSAIDCLIAQLCLRARLRVADPRSGLRRRSRDSSRCERITPGTGRAGAGRVVTTPPVPRALSASTSFSTSAVFSRMSGSLAARLDVEAHISGSAYPGTPTSRDRARNCPAAA